MEPQAPVVPNVSQPAPETPKDNHGITIAAMAIFVLLALGAVVFLYYQNQQLKNLLVGYQNKTPIPTATPTEIPQMTASPSASPSTKPVACTQEAKLCPDGSSVGRTGPKCEFAPCPTP